jgi:hypothetical protein
MLIPMAGQINWNIGTLSRCDGRKGYSQMSHDTADAYHPLTNFSWRFDSRSNYFTAILESQAFSFNTFTRWLSRILGT